MLYQRRIPDNQIVSAKLELQLRGGRYAGVGTQLLGILGLGGAALYSVETVYLVGWAISLVVSTDKSNAFSKSSLFPASHGAQ
jgi:hypothetical protein